MTHGFSIGCLFVCLFVGHIFWWIITYLSEPHKVKGEIFVMAIAQLIFPAQEMAKNCK